MITPRGDLYEISCDNCSSGAETITADSWREMIDQLKDMGWLMRKDLDGEWVHICPDCNEW